MVWERVNHQRHSRFTRSWKSFCRAWRGEDPVWPTEEAFEFQHQRLLGAARRYGLAPNPIAGTKPADLVQAAVQEILAMQRFTSDDVAAVLPPVYELLP